MKKCIAGLGLIAVACSAIAADEIKLSAEQIKSLGIATAAPVADREAPVSALTATVVVPNSQMHVVSAPLAALVETLSAAVGEPVKRGQPLARLQSPQLAETERAFLQAATQLALATGQPQARPAAVRRRHHRREPLPHDAGRASGRGRVSRRAAPGPAPRRPVRRRDRRAADQAEGRQHADVVRACGRRDSRADGDRGATRRCGRSDLQARAARSVVARDPGAGEPRRRSQGGSSGDRTAP